MVFKSRRCGVIKWVIWAWIASGLGVAGSGMLHRSLDLTPTRLALIPSTTKAPSSISSEGGGGGGGGGGFCDWVEASSPDAVSGLWMEIITELEERRALKDYHLTILPTKAFESIGAAMGMGDLDDVPFLVIATHSIKRKGIYALKFPMQFALPGFSAWMHRYCVLANPDPKHGPSNQRVSYIAGEIVPLTLAPRSGRRASEWTLHVMRSRPPHRKRRLARPGTRQACRR